VNFCPEKIENLSFQKIDFQMDESYFHRFEKFVMQGEKPAARA